MNVITGPLNSTTALQWVAEGQRWIDAASSECVIDFSEASTVNSAGIAVLLAWQRYANQQHKKLLLQQLPAKLLAMLDLYSLKAVFY